MRGTPQRSVIEENSRQTLTELATILGLPNSNPSGLLETVRKLEKVVKAVPRMESFIHNVSKAMGDEGG